MTFLVFFISTRVSDVVTAQVVGNMTTALEGQANLIEQFVADSELALKEYATAPDIKKLLSEPENPEYIESAQKYTERYFANLVEWEGIYLSNWDTKVLAHSSAGAAGKGFAVVASEIKNLSENSSAAANAISEVCKEMNANVENIKSCFGEIISFMRKDVSAIFTDMHGISERLKNSMEEANHDLDAMATIVRNIKSETSQLSTIIADNESFAGSIHEKTEATRDMINELDVFIGKNMETVKDINAIVSRFEH